MGWVLGHRPMGTRSCRGRWADVFRDCSAGIQELRRLACVFIEAEIPRYEMPNLGQRPVSRERGIWVDHRQNECLVLEGGVVRR